MKSFANLTMLLAVVLFGAGCFPHDWGECENGGEMIEGGCICPDGWGGATCEYYLPKEFAGTYSLDTIIGDSLPFLGPTLQWIDSSVVESQLVPIVLLKTDQLYRPLIARWTGYHERPFVIEDYENFKNDSSGSLIPIQLQCEISVYNWRSSSLLTIYFHYPDRFLRYSRQ